MKYILLLYTVCLRSYVGHGGDPSGGARGWIHKLPYLFVISFSITVLYSTEAGPLALLVHVDHVAQTKLVPLTPA